MEDSRPLKSRITEMMQEFSYDEVRQVLEFCKNLKPKEETAPKVRAPKEEKEAPAPQPVQEMHVDIDYLCGKWMHCVGLVAQWTYDTYFKGKRPESYEKVLASTKVCYAAMLPIRLVAVNGPECVGSISIVKFEQEERSLTPLMTFLCVPSKYKNMGIEQKLIGHGVKVLKGLGYKEVFIKIDKQSLLPEGYTWEAVKGCQGIYTHSLRAM